MIQGQKAKIFPKELMDQCRDLPGAVLLIVQQHQQFVFRDLHDRRISAAGQGDRERDVAFIVDRLAHRRMDQIHVGQEHVRIVNDTWDDYILADGLYVDSSQEIILQHILKAQHLMLMFDHKEQFLHNMSLLSGYLHGTKRPQSGVIWKYHPSGR